MQADTIETETQDLVREERAWYGALQEEVQSLVEQNEVLWTQKGELKDQKVLLLGEMDGLRTDLEELGYQNFTFISTMSRYF